MPTLSIVIPAYNEEPRLGNTLEHIRRAMHEGMLPNIEVTQIIIADDGSTDATMDVAHSWKDRLPIDTVSLPKNKGKGAATREGMKKVSAEYALIYDADGATPITELPRFFALLTRESADIAIGSRLHDEDGRPVEMSSHRRIIGRLYHALCGGLHPGIEDAACGCKLFTKEAAEKIFSMQKIHRFAYDIEILALARKFDFSVLEVPVTWSAVPRSKVRLIRDGVQMFWSVLRMYLWKLRGKL